MSKSLSSLFSIPKISAKNMNLYVKNNNKKQKINKNDFRNKLTEKKHGNIAKFGIELGKVLLESQIGNTHISAIEIGKSLLSNNNNALNNRIIASHSNSYKKITSTIKKSTIHIGSPIEGKFKSVPAFHTINEIELFCTKKDCISPSKRKKLTSKAGFNERSIILLGKSTYLTIEDLKSFTESNKAIQRIKALRSRKTDKMDRTGISKIVYRKRQGNAKIHSAIRKLNYKLTIISDMIAYDTHVIVHICLINDLKCSLGPRAVLQRIKEECEEIETNSLNANQVLEQVKHEESEEFDFKSVMKLSIDSNIKKSDSFKENIKIIKTIRRLIPENGQVVLDITEHFNKGVELNQLSKVIEDDMPASSFIIIECFGDRRANLINKEEGVKYSGYSPTELRFEFKKTITYTASQENEDMPINIINKEKNKDFIDDDLGAEWYPDRESEFHVNIQDIEINGINTKSKYKLSLNDQYEPSRGQELLNRLNQMLVEGNQKEITEDEMETRIDQTEDNLREEEGIEEEEIIDLDSDLDFDFDL